MPQDVSARIAHRLGISPPYALALSAIFVGLTFGGSSFQWLPSEFVCQVFGTVFLAVGLFQFLSCPGTVRLRFELGLAAVIPLAPALQVIPLPPWLWTRLPGRHFLVDEFHAVGMSPLPWQPISFSPDATWQALLSLVLPLAIFLACLLLSFTERRRLSLAVVTYVGVSVLLALMQQVGGTDSPLRFYALTNESLPVGMFANRNHFAALLYCALPFVGAWMIASKIKQSTSRRSSHLAQKHALFFLTSATAFVALLLTQGLVHSRAGLLISVLGVCMCMSLAIPLRRSDLGRKTIKAFLGSIFVAIVLIVYFASFSILQQFDRDPVEDLRFSIVRGSLQAMRAFFPIGAGFGTFDVVYQLFERPSGATSEYVNRAHDDFIETVMEGGVSTLVLLLFFFAWLLRRTWHVWTSPAFRDASVIDAALARGAAFVPFLLAAHSVLDYPLRTEAIMSLAAMSCALVVPPVNRGTERTRTPERKRRRIHPSSPEWIASQSRQLA